MDSNAIQTAPESRLRKPRPALFRALGRADPPDSIDVDGRRYQRRRVLKHDSFAATAIYAHPESRIVCKFNRRHSVLGVPAFWLGWWLAHREAGMYRRLADDPNVPAGCGAVHVNGRPARNAVAHEYVPGRTLSEEDTPSDEFLLEMNNLLDRLRVRGVAYIDLHKLDNIIVGDDGKPYLIDFQISLWLPRVWPLTWLFQYLHQFDRYHFLKHVTRMRPDACSERDHAWVGRKPLLIRFHRRIADPFRRFRRAILVHLRVRSGAGEAFTELPPDRVALQSRSEAESRAIRRRPNKLQLTDLRRFDNCRHPSGTGGGAIGRGQ